MKLQSTLPGTRDLAATHHSGRGIRTAWALAVCAAALLPFGSVAQQGAPFAPVSVNEQAAAAPAPANAQSLTDADRDQLLRAAQLQHWLGLPIALPVALCVQAASNDWPSDEPQERDIERWRLAWERCDTVQDPTQGSYRLVTQARKNMQASVQRLQVAWRQCAACAELALQQPAQGAACLQQALGRSPSAEEKQWLLAQQDSLRASRSGR